MQTSRIIASNCSMQIKSRVLIMFFRVATLHCFFLSVDQGNVSSWSVWFISSIRTRYWHSWKHVYVFLLGIWRLFFDDNNCITPYFNFIFHDLFCWMDGLSVLQLFQIFSLDATRFYICIDVCYDLFLEMFVSSSTYFIADNSKRIILFWSRYPTLLWRCR